MSIFTGMSNREQNIWAELGINLAVSSYYFINVYSIPGGVGINSPEMGRIIGTVIIYSIIGSIVLFSAINWKRGEEPEDERDYRFKARANAISYWTLIVCVVALISFILYNGSDFSYHPLGVIEFTPLLNANVLLFSLLISSTLGALMQLIHYRRGF